MELTQLAALHDSELDLSCQSGAGTPVLEEEESEAIFAVKELVADLRLVLVSIPIEVALIPLCQVSEAGLDHIGRNLDCLSTEVDLVWAVGVNRKLVHISLPGSLHLMVKFSQS